jgi:hypothetical protein
LLACLHLGINFPLWIINFWTDLHPVSIAHAAWKYTHICYVPWRICNISTPPLLHLQHISPTLEMFFETVGWDEKLELLCCSSELARLFCEYWLNDRMMDSMTHIIAACTQERPENTKVFSMDRNLYWYIADKDWKWSQYKTAKNFTHLQETSVPASRREPFILLWSQ